MVISSSSFPLLAPVVNKAKKRMSCPDPTTAIHRSIVSRACGQQQQQQQQQQAPDPRDWEDGPVFRATISQLEAKTSSLKAAIKHILKAATASLRAHQALLQADTEFIASLHEMSSTEPLFRHYLDDAWDRMQQQREQLQHSMQTLLIDPLQKLYDMDVKQAEVKRRQFEDESKRYYASLSRYLGGKKASTKSETKHLAAKCRFDMIRFDYYTFLVDLHCGKKDTELLYHLLNLQQRQHTYHAAMSHILDTGSSGLQTFASLIVNASREHTAMYKERSETRKALEAGYREAAAASSTSTIPPTPTTAAVPPATLPSIDTSHLSFGGANGCLHERKAESLFHGIRDLQCYDRDLRDIVGRRKEGVLFATSRPLKVNDSDKPPTGVPWHKYWCVLSAGQLYEYSNWKRSLESHMEPVNLRFATVRLARNTDRRFCFEVITPKFRRLYQAVSRDDMQTWITTINNAIESVLNGQGSALDLVPQHQQESQENKRPKSWVATASSHKLSLEGALVNLTTDAKEKKRKLHRHSIGHTNAPANKRRASTAITPHDLVQTIYRADDANTRCADCGAGRPEWCSINLGIFLCIECSGIHRSMGSHVSKVRSLTLDSNSFTPEVIEMLLSVGNACANAVWDARQNTGVYAIAPSDPRDVKVEYILAKYQHLTYIDHCRASDGKTPQQMLFDAIHINSIPKALEAIALGAHVNTPQQQQTTTLDGLMTGDHGPAIADNDKPQFIALPMLDADGCHIPDKSLMLPLPLQQRCASPLARYPLHLALASGSLAMAEFLFQHGADTSIVDPETGSTLHDTIAHGTLVRERAMSYYLHRIDARHKPSPSSPSHHNHRHHPSPFLHPISSTMMDNAATPS